VPYTKYSIPFIIKVLTLRYIDDKSIMDVQTYLSGFDKERVYIDLSASSINAFKDFILEVINKLLSSGYYQDAEKLLQKPSDNKRIRAFIEFSEVFCCYRINPYIRGPCALSYDFYTKGGGCFWNSYFLFGAPSQFRIA
ncbi:hypothetical protein KA005_65080, partial [bacterium]|nr:hypothetical protein [bacterium]